MPLAREGWECCACDVPDVSREALLAEAAWALASARRWCELAHADVATARVAESEQAVEIAQAQGGGK